MEEYQDFPSKTFCLAVPKKFAGVPFCAVYQETPVAKKFMDKSGEYDDFPSEFFSLTVAKLFIGESFPVALISGTEQIWIRGGGVSRFSVGEFLSHSAENFRRGTS